MGRPEARQDDGYGFPVTNSSVRAMADNVVVGLGSRAPLPRSKHKTKSPGVPWRVSARILTSIKSFVRTYIGQRDIGPEIIPMIGRKTRHQ